MKVLLDKYVDAGDVAAVARQGGDRGLEYSYCMSKKSFFLKCERRFLFYGVGQILGQGSGGLDSNKSTSSLPPLQSVP